MKKLSTAIILRWTARITGFFSVAFFMSFMLGEGLHDIIRGEGKQLLPFLPFLLLAVCGYFVALFREKKGSLMMIAGGLLLMLYLFYFQDYTIGLIYGLPFIIPGTIFYLASLSHTDKTTQ